MIGSYPTLGITKHTVVNVQPVSTLVRPNDPSRSYALIQNDSDTDIYLSFNAEAIVNSGILLCSKGSYEMGFRWGSLHIGEIHAIHSGIGPKRLLVTEVY
jgi:hypothetical protein